MLEVCPNREAAGEVGFACNLAVGSHGFQKDEGLDGLPFPCSQAW